MSSVVSRQSSIVSRQSSIVNRQSSIVKNSVRNFTRLSSACLIGLMLSEASFAANCTTAVAPNGNTCSCTDGTTMQSKMSRGAANPGQTFSTVSAKKCSNASDSICNEAVNSNDTSCYISAEHG